MINSARLAPKPRMSPPSEPTNGKFIRAEWTSDSALGFSNTVFFAPSTCWPPTPTIVVTTTCAGTVSFRGGYSSFTFTLYVYPSGATTNYSTSTTEVGAGGMSGVAPGTYEYAYGPESGTSGLWIQGHFTIAACPG